MVQTSGVSLSAYPLHVTQRSVRSIPIFNTDRDRNVHLDFMTEELNHFGLDVFACLSRRITHLILVQNDLVVLALAIGQAPRRYKQLRID